MTDYGNYFTSNSGNYNYNTRGHSFDDSDWVIVELPNSGNVSQPIPYPDGIDFTGNDTTCYFQTTNNMSNPNREVKTGNDHVAYFNWATDNKNIKGSIGGNFDCYLFGSKTDSRFVEPIGLDDTKHGVSPYSDSNNNAIYRTNLTVKGTTFTAGYRKNKIQYEPSIKYDLISYNYGTNDNYKSDGKTKATGTRVPISRYDAFQTFYNIEDPYSVLSISIANHDDAKSSSPIFCTLTNNKSEYRISHSYTYNPYKNSATWNNTNYLSFTYNTLPTYPKELVFTYGSNYKSISYDGGTITVEAKAWYNGTYDRFTTSTANDDGFSSYKRYVDVTYSLSTFNSSTTPTGSNTYTFRIWQPGSKLGISYNWSIDGNLSWVHLSKTTGNTTKVTFDDQGDDKPSVGGTLSLALDATNISNGGSTSGSVSGVSWTAPTNKGARACVLRQNMTVTNCCAQNITPKTISGQPYRALTLTQRGMHWNNPSFDMKWKVTQGSKTTTTYNDDYGHGWPTVSIGGLETSNGTEKTTGWIYDSSSKSVSVSMPTISRPWVNTYSNGKVTITKGSNDAVSYKGGDVTIKLHPDITFRQGFTSGVSERTWTISNTANTPTNQEYWTLKEFKSVDIKLPAIGAANHAFGNATLSWKDTGTQDLTFSKASKTWNNNNTDDSFTATLASNPPIIGNWYASASNGTLTFTSTTKNSSATSGTISFSGSTYQDGVLTPSPSTITISQNGTNISGTITIKGTGEGINSCDESTKYPIDGKSTSANYSLKLAKQLYVTGQKDLTPGVNYTTIPWNGATITMSKASGTVETESATSKKQDYSISVSSNIVSSKPANPANGIVLSGSVQPKSANYKYQYKVDTGSWSDSTTKYIQRNSATVDRDYSLDLKSSDEWTDVNEGIYKYTSRYYKTANPIDHIIKIRVVDTNNSSITYEGNSIIVSQNGQEGWYYVMPYTFVTSGINCTTSTPVGPADKNYDESIDYGAFTVSNITSPDPNPSGDTGSSENISTYIYNYSDKLSEGNFPTTKPTATFEGSSQEFKYNVPVSTYLGVKSISALTVNYKHTGKKTWNYMYSFSIHPESPDGWIGDTQTTTKSSSGSVGPLIDSTYTAKMAVVEGTGDKNWQSLTGTGKKTVHITKPGTYVIYVAWFNGDNKYNELNSSTITITSQQKQFRIKLTLNITNASTKIYWATDAWTLKVTGYQLQSKEGAADWTDDSSSITGITYTWTGADSTNGNTATVNVSSTTPGSNGSNIGSGKTVSVTVSSAEGYSGTGSFGLYRFGQDYGGYLGAPFLSDGHVYVGSTPTKRSSTSTEYPDSLPATLTFSSSKKSGSGSLSASGNKDFKSTTLDICTYTQDSASLTWTTIKLDNVTVGAEEGTHDVTPTNSPNYTAGSDGKFTISVSTLWNVPDVDSPYTGTSDPTFNGQSTFDIEIPGEKLDVNDYYKWSFTPDKGVTGVTLSNNTKRTVKINYPNNPKPRGENITDEFNEWIWTNDSYVLTKEIKENKDKVGFYKVIGGVTGAQDSRPLGTLKLDYTKTGTSATTKVTQNGKTAGEQTNSATFKVSNQINCSCLVDTSISATGNNEDIAYITKFTTAGVKWNKASLNIKEGTFTKYGENYDKCSSTTTIDKPIKCTIGCTENTENNITVVAIPSAIIDRLKMNGISSNSSKTVVGPASNKMVKPKKRTIKYIWKLDGESYDETTNTIEVTTTPSTTGTRTFALDECTVTDEYENNSAYPEISGQTFITRYQLGYEWKFVVTTGTGYQYSVVIYSTKTQTQTETIEHLYWDENASTFNLNVYVRCWYRTTENGSDYNEWIEIDDPKVTYSWKDSGNIITEANGNNTKVDLKPGKGYNNSKDKIVTCTATYKETYHSTCTFTLKHYGQTYLNTVDDLSLVNDDVFITMIPAKLSNKTTLYPNTLPGTIKFTSEKLNSIIDNGNGTLNLYDKLININDCKSGNTTIKTGILIGKVTLDNGVLTWDNITLNTINNKIMVSASGGNEPISTSDEPKYEPGKDTFFKINVDTKWNIPIEDTPYTNAGYTRFDPKVSTPDLTQPSTSLTYTYFKIPAGKLDVDNYYSWSFEPSEGIDETKVYLDSKTIKSKICHLIYDKNEGESGSDITPAVNDWIKETSVILPKEIDDKSNDTTNYSKKLEFYTVTGGVSTGIKERPLGTIKLEYTYNKNTASASVVQQGTPNGKGTQSAEFEITKTFNCANIVIDKSIFSEGAKTQSAYITKFTRIKKYENTIINVSKDSFKTDSTDYDKCKSVTSISKPIKCTIGATEDRTGIKVVNPFLAIIKLSKKNDIPVQNNTKAFIGPSFIENLPSDAIIKYNWLCDGKKYNKTTKTIEVTTTPDVIGIRTFKLDSVDISATIENHEINKKYELKNYEWTFEVTSMTAIYNIYVYCGTNVDETNTTQTIEHTYFDTNASTFDLNVHIVCEMATSTDGVNFGDFTVIDDPGVIYNWDYGNSTTSTNKVTVSAGKNATDGNITDVTCTIFYEESTASCTFTLKNYGATVDFTGTLKCSDDKTITAFDPQTYDTTASISDYKVTATSGTSTKDWTKTYNYTLNATKHTLTAVQGTNATTLGTSSYKYTFACPIDKIPKNIHIGTDASTSHTVNLYCYGKSYYNA